MYQDVTKYMIDFDNKIILYDYDKLTMMAY